MKINLKEKIIKLFSMKHSKLVSILLVIAIIGTTVFANRVTIKNKIFGSSSNSTQNTAKVTKGDLKDTVSGSGSIYFATDKILYTKIGATVTKMNYKEGDQVKSGDVIAEFDDSDFQSTIESSQLSLDQTEITVESDKKAISNLTITAPFTGQITDVAVNTGDTVQSGGTVLTISDTSKLRVTLTYNSTDISKIKVGQSATVNIASTMQSAKGTVTYVGNQSIGTSVGGKVYSVDLELANPGAITSGMVASADIKTSSGTVSSTNTAALSYNKTQEVTSKTGGTVKSINVRENQKVTSGDVVMVMKDDDLQTTLKTDELKLESLQSALALSEEQLDNYKIVAPIDGTITTISYKVGDTVVAGDEIAEVADTSVMEFDISVDELDISTLAVGQSAEISLDALSDTTDDPLDGEVAKVAVTGTSSSGVTTYAVTVKISDSLDTVKGGMNANAVITVTDDEDVLMVPIDAVTTVGTDSYVWVKNSGTSSVRQVETPTSSTSTTSSESTVMGGGPGGGGGGGGGGGQKSANTNDEATTSTVFVESSSSTADYSGTGSSDSYYANCIRQKVTVGTENDSYIEIKSGLTEGQTVILPQTTSATSSTSTANTTTATTGMGGGGMGGGGMGGGGGGM